MCIVGSHASLCQIYVAYFYFFFLIFIPFFPEFRSLVKAAYSQTVVNVQLMVSIPQFHKPLYRGLFCHMHNVCHSDTPLMNLKIYS